MKIHKCRDAGVNCEAVITAETVEEVLAQAVTHAQAVHGVAVIANMSEEIAKKIHG